MKEMLKKQPEEHRELLLKIGHKKHAKQLGALLKRFMYFTLCFLVTSDGFSTEKIIKVGERMQETLKDASVVERIEIDVLTTINYAHIIVICG